MNAILAERMKARPCACGCERMVAPNPEAALMTANNKPLYATVACKTKVTYERQKLQREKRKRKVGRVQNKRT